MSVYQQMRRGVDAEQRSFEQRALISASKVKGGGMKISDMLADGQRPAGLFASPENDASKGYATFSQWVFAAVNCIAGNLAGQAWAAGELTNAAKRKPSKHAGPQLSEPWIRKSIPSRLMTRAVSKQELKMLESHAVLDLMDKPNVLQRKWEFLYMSCCNLLLTGTCYWIGGAVQQSRRTPNKQQTQQQDVEIWAIPSTMITPLHRTGLFSHYKVKINEHDQGQVIDGKNVCRIYLPDPSDLFGCYSPLQACWKAVRTDHYIQGTQEQLFERGLTPKIALVVGEGATGKVPMLQGPQRRQLTRAIREIWDQTVSYGDPAILDALIKDVKRLDPSAQEMDWQQSGEVVRDRVFSSFRVNKFNVGMSEQMNRAQVVEAQRALARNVVNPIIDSMSEAACDWVGPMFETSEGRRLWIWIECM